MLKRVLYYGQKLLQSFHHCFSMRRIRQFGLRLAALDFCIFLCHRSDSAFSHALIRKRDKIVQKYLYRHYGKLIQQCRDMT